MQNFIDNPSCSNVKKIMTENDYRWNFTLWRTPLAQILILNTI
jgi:hypothetical protein